MCFVITIWCLLGVFDVKCQKSRSSIHLSVRTGAEWSILVLLPSTAKCLVQHKSVTLLKNIRESSSQGAFKMVERSKLLMFRQVAPSRLITLLILMWREGPLKLCFSKLWHAPDLVRGFINLGLFLQHNSEWWLGMRRDTFPEKCIVTEYSVRLCNVDWDA